MSIIEDIRTIAKTKELEDKIAKVGQDSTLADKSEVGAKKVSVPQNSNGGSSLPISTGNEPPIEVVNSSGTIIQEVINAAIEAAATNNTSQGDTDQSISERINNGIVQLRGRLSSNNLSGSASNELIQGGSNLLAQAQRGSGDTTLDALKTALIAAHAQQDKIDQVERKYLDWEKGMQHGQAIADDEISMPRPSVGWTSLEPKTSAEILKGIVGFDINQTVSPFTSKPLAVQIRFDGLYPTPTVEDQLADNNDIPESPWIDPSTGGPIGWQLGYYWEASSPAAAEGATPEQAINNAIEAIKIAFPDPYPTGYANAYWDITTLIQESDTEWNFTWYQGPSGIPNEVSVNRAACPGLNPSSCPLTAPSYAEWPSTGTYVLSFVDGLFTGHPYDGELPFMWHLGASVVNIALGDGDTVIDDRTIRVQPAYNGFAVSVLDSMGEYEKIKIYGNDGEFVADVAPENIRSWIPR